MEEDIKETPVDQLVGHVEELASTYYKLAILTATEKAATLASMGIAVVIASVAGLMVLLLGGFGFSWWLGNLIESRTGGFLLGAVLFLLVMIIVLLIRKKVLFPFFRDLIIRKIYE